MIFASHSTKPDPMQKYGGEMEREKRRLLTENQGLSFQLPPAGIPAKEFVAEHFGPGSNAKTLQFLHGTTTLGFVYEPKTENDKGGVIVAADSRASSGGYIASKSVKKILDVSDRMVATMAGGAADCQFWVRFLAKYCSLFELREKRPITVSAASKYLSEVLYSYKGMGLSVHSMIAGYDNKGPGLYMVTSDGQRVGGRVFSLGSGCLNAYSILDNFYAPKMTDEEARDLGRKAIMHATLRDAGSGGTCNMVHITSDTKHHFEGIDVSEMWFEYNAKLGRDVVYEPTEDQ